MDKLKASEALYGFCGWITTREKEVRAGANNECSVWAELVDKFCKHNNLDEPRDDWDKNLKIHPKD